MKKIERKLQDRNNFKLQDRNNFIHPNEIKLC